MSAKHKINIVQSGSIIGTTTLTLTQTGTKIQIDYKDTLNNRGSVAEEDYFTALSFILEQYAAKTLQLLCVGGHIDVYPGGLASDQSVNEIAYRFNSTDNSISTINIFSPIDISELEALTNTPAQKSQRKAAIHSKKFRVRP